jgi:hypothetical protein
MLMLQIQVDLVEEAMDGQRTASFLDLRPSTVHGALLCGPQQSHVFISEIHAPTRSLRVLDEVFARQSHYLPVSIYSHIDSSSIGTSLSFNCYSSVFKPLPSSSTSMMREERHILSDWHGLCVLPCLISLWRGEFRIETLEMDPHYVVGLSHEGDSVWLLVPASNLNAKILTSPMIEKDVGGNRLWTVIPSFALFSFPMRHSR